MSVLIKGMKMPKTCNECYMNIAGTCAISAYRDDGYECVHGGKPEDCPLVNVPTPHGPLIDAEEVKNAVFHHLSIKDERYLLPAEKSLFGNVIKAHTVIEAEEC